MSNVFDLIYEGLQVLAEEACNSETSTELSREAFLPLAVLSEVIKPRSTSLSDGDLAARSINLVGVSCKVMNSHQKNFKETDLYHLCKTFITSLCNEMDIGLFHKTYWLSRIDESLPVE